MAQGAMSQAALGPRPWRGGEEKKRGWMHSPPPAPPAFKATPKTGQGHRWGEHSQTQSEWAGPQMLLAYTHPGKSAYPPGSCLQTNCYHPLFS